MLEWHFVPLMNAMKYHERRIQGLQLYLLSK